jgi:hypothetical protein
MCGISEFRVNTKPHNKTAYLIPKIMVTETPCMAKTFRKFRSSSEAVVAADGYFIE